MAVVRGVVEPTELEIDSGAMLTVWIGEASGYCATADLSARGLRDAAAHALGHARRALSLGFIATPAPLPAGALLEWRARKRSPLPGPRDLVERLRVEESAMREDARIVHSLAQVVAIDERVRLWLNAEPVADQYFDLVWPRLEALASDSRGEQFRSLGGRGNGACRQGGAEVLDATGFSGGGARLARDAIELLGAKPCPDARMSLLLAPDQMMLQVHESIGHPLELDRILGDERNFAGGSFVTPEMFGRYRYGSKLLNVCVDASHPDAMGSAACDDEGQPVREAMLIESGILLRPIGGAASAARLGDPAIGPLACARAAGWQRPAIDRMPNVDVLPGETTFEQMLASIDRGILMRTNASWSIDDRRDKFQFACEWGRLIDRGRLGPVVRNPGYRGRSAVFWRSLAAVGDRACSEVQGTPFCGKGEPGQIVRVGHVTPACLFEDVEVFGTGA